jgi:hypothetical protein
MTVKKSKAVWFGRKYRLSCRASYLRVHSREILLPTLPETLHGVPGNGKLHNLNDDGMRCKDKERIILFNSC